MANGSPPPNRSNGKALTGRFTPTERRMLTLLADGMPHTRFELHKCLWDDLSPLQAIWAHISNIRAKIRPQGHDIICEIYNRTVHYRHVILLVDPAGDKA
jgi:DNA-binding CsgD family transcriptional regulator